MPHPLSTQPNLVISQIGPESDALLRNLAEHYCHDMSEWFDLNTGADGSYSYDTASVWAKRYHAYLAKVDDSIAGFALIGSADEWLDDLGAHDVREFFILRKFRRRSIGRSMARFLWNEYAGEWLVRVLEANAPAATFWRCEISSYSVGSYGETEHIINGRRWKFFRFISNQAQPESLIT
jgi:predicted acetyltransferase